MSSYGLPGPRLKRRAISRRLGAVIVAVIIVAAAIIVIFAASPAPSISIRIAASTNVGVAGSPISFTIIPSVSGSSVTSASWNFGDGVNATTDTGNATHAYADGGHYVVYVKADVKYQGTITSTTEVVTNSLSLFNLQIQPAVPTSEASNIAVPSINFVSPNGNSPLLNVGQTANLIGGYLESPANSNWTISSYEWNFANGNQKTFAANQTTGLPSSNASVSYSAAGIYPLSLTLSTTGPGNASLSVTTYQTFVVSSVAGEFAILSVTSGVVNPNIITSVEVVPGGPYSFDPQVDDEANIGFEIIMNIYQTLVAYKGSPTDTFIPVIASSLPTVQNGISPDYMTYTFSIRPDQFFSNGDPVDAYTVWFSLVRDMAFTGGSPGTPGWLLGQYVIPGVNNGTGNVYTNNTWTAVTNAFTYSAQSNTVTIHFNRPMPPTLAFQILSDPLGVSIVDVRYAASVGAGFGEGNWTNYMSMGTEGSYNTQMQFQPVGSGPYMIENYLPGQSIELIPNPHYTGVPGIAPVNKTVVIDWVKNADTGLLMFQDGQADSISFLPNSDFTTIQGMQSQGTANIYNFASFEEWYYTFNANISKSIEASQFGPGFNEPSNYFADVPTRLMFVDAFPYADYLNNLLGNKKYGANFGLGYQGIIPPGMIYAPDPSLLGGLPQQNFKDAKGNFSISAWHDQKITVPIIVYVADPLNLAAAEEWASALSQVSGGNITAKPIQIPIEQQIADLVPANAMGVYWDNWAPDYPDPSDYVFGMYANNGDYAPANNWGMFSTLAPNTPGDVVNLNGTSYSQSVVYQWLQGNVTLADTSTSPSVRQQAYLLCDRLAIALGLYIYVDTQQAFWFWRSWLTGYATEENPMLNAAGNLVYYYLNK